MVLSFYFGSMGPELRNVIEKTELPDFPNWSTIFQFGVFLQIPALFIVYITRRKTVALTNQFGFTLYSRHKMV
jgi:hypothetical protein